MTNIYIHIFFGKLALLPIQDGLATISVTFTIQADYASIVSGNEQQFKQSLINQLATLLGISGSVIQDIILSNGKNL